MVRKRAKCGMECERVSPACTLLGVKGYALFVGGCALNALQAAEEAEDAEFEAEEKADREAFLLRCDCKVAVARGTERLLACCGRSGVQYIRQLVICLAALLPCPMEPYNTRYRHPVACCSQRTARSSLLHPCRCHRKGSAHGAAMQDAHLHASLTQLTHAMYAGRSVAAPHRRQAERLALLQRRKELLLTRGSQANGSGTAAAASEPVPELPPDEELREAPPPAFALTDSDEEEGQGQGTEADGGQRGQDGRRRKGPKLAVLPGKRRRVMDVLAETLGAGGGSGEGSSGEESEAEGAGVGGLDWRAKTL